MAQCSRKPYRCLATLATVSGLVATGWNLHAGAWQAAKRSVIPRASDVRAARQSPPPNPVTPLIQPGGQAAQAGSTGGSVDQQKNAFFDGDDFSYVSDAMDARNFIYKQDDTTVTGDKAHYNRKTRVLDATGRLVVEDPKYHMTGEKARYDNSPNVKEAVITGSVVIVMKPKDKPAANPADDVDKEKSKGATAYCDRLDYHKLKDFSVLTGHVVFKQKITKDDGKTVERTVTAEHAEYDGAANQMHLFAPVELTDTEDQAFHFDKDVFVGTKEGEETVKSTGRFKGKINVPEDEGKPATGAKSADKNPPSAGTPAGAGKESPPPATGKKESPPAGEDPKQTPPPKQNP